jgi:hypothetical protein
MDTMRRTVAAVIFAWLFVTMPAVPSQAATNAEKFATTAEIDRASLDTDLYKRAGRFYTDVTVKNIGASPQAITTWTNPGWSWVTDSEGVDVSQEAAKNFPSPIKLKSGEIYKSRLEMATNPKGFRPVTFRLGFLPNASTPITDAHDPTLIWSNPVMLTQ